jgi:hypothetical protein
LRALKGEADETWLVRRPLRITSSRWRRHMRGWRTDKAAMVQANAAIADGL